ncbi:hypothetical protein BVZ80_00365A, partial [Haemophilus influenzae]
MARTGSR